MEQHLFGPDDACERSGYEEAELLSRFEDLATVLIGVVRAGAHLAQVMPRSVGQRAVESALAEYEQTIGDAKAIRNILEHFDEYMAGDGVLQRRGKMSELRIEFDELGCHLPECLWHGNSTADDADDHLHGPALRIAPFRFHSVETVDAAHMFVGKVLKIVESPAMCTS